MNSLSFARSHFEFPMFFAISLWIYHKFTISFENRLWILFDEFTMNLLSLSRISFEFTILSKNSLLTSYIFRKFTMFLLSFSRISLEFTMNSLSYSWIHYEFTIFHANSLWIHNLFVNSLWFYYLFREFPLNSLWIHYPIREFTINSPSFARIHYEFSIFFANSL